MAKDNTLLQRVACGLLCVICGVAMKTWIVGQPRLVIHYRATTHGGVDWSHTTVYSG